MEHGPPLEKLTLWNPEEIITHTLKEETTLFHLPCIGDPIPITMLIGEQTLNVPLFTPLTLQDSTSMVSNGPKNIFTPTSTPNFSRYSTIPSVNHFGIVVISPTLTPTELESPMFGLKPVVLRHLLIKSSTSS